MKCLNCNKKLKENIQSFCEECETKLTWTEKEHLLSEKVIEAINHCSDRPF